MAPVPLDACGDSRVTPPEECDDGNNSLGDGCDPLCGLESGFACPNPGAPCVSTVVCGDGVVGPGEICDDANASSNDGCAGDCKSIELGFRCQPGRPCAPACGDGIVRGAEQCDDGNVSSSDGCSATCRLEPGFVCPNDSNFRVLRQSDSAEPSNVGGAPGVPPTPVTPAPMIPVTAVSPTSVPGAEAPAPSPGPTLPLPEPLVPCRPSVCGDGVVEGGEGCDDGNLESSDGCRPDCVLEPYCAEPNDCVTVCGDGLVLSDGDEACDDGNSFAGDGCDQSCRLEPGFQCELVVDTWPDSMPTIYLESRGHSECAALCGDGLVVGGEECDDGAMNGAGYGYCAADCNEGPRCGDGQVDGDHEQCDNGINSALYYIEESSCAPGCLLPAFCGDGITDPTFGERCDRGAESNIGEYGGCSPVCELTGTCGNGVVESTLGEQCDDGNQNRGDGCDSCRAETTATGGAPGITPVLPATPDDVFVPPVSSPPTETEAPHNPCN